MLVQVNENISYKIKRANNNRLSEMGLVKGITFRIVKKVSGMVQIRLPDSDIVIREELFKDIELDEIL